jgi:hypothetical protein
MALIQDLGLELLDVRTLAEPDDHDARPAPHHGAFHGLR